MILKTIKRPCVNSSSPNLKESVTAVFKFSGDKEEYLLLKRAHHLKAFPGYTSFVGGKVDQDDREREAVLKGYDHIESSWLNAIVREVTEEVEYELVLNKSNIVSITHLGTATTPSFQKVRFKNQYILIELKEKFIPKNDEGEILSSTWQTLNTFFEEDERGEHMMVPPSRELLKRQSKGILDINKDLNLEFSDDCVPEIEMVRGISILMPLSNTFPPAYRTNCFYLSGEQKILIDPSPAGMKEYNRLVNTLGERKIDFIFLTHHHIDHFENVNHLARELSVPIKLSKKTYDLISNRTPRNYFAKIKIDFLKEGDVLCSWKGAELIVHEVPGHASGQLAIVDSMNRIYIVSDLIQTIGTVMVTPPNGDMAKYFNSLSRVINLNPNFVFPSHGLPMGGVEKLKSTLLHRKGREEHIKKLLEMNKSTEEIYKIIYPFLNDNLKHYALGTIQAHIEKIESEK